MKDLMQIIKVNAILMLLCNLVTWAEPVLVVSKQSPLNSVKQVELQRYFCGKAKTISGHKLNLILQVQGKTHADFLQSYIKRSPVKLSKTWKKLIFTGKAKMPKQAKNDGEVVAILKSSPNHIGYIDEKSLTDELKKIKIK
ncbi:MAG: hypothetical protein HQL32_06285 [Planctomycetes bacterium]|nr:hypothetical protein [Planctomycetota bacterium]